MARARVELIAGKSHRRGNRAFKLEQPQYLTDADEIGYYAGNSAFKVVMLEDYSAETPPTPKAVVVKTEETEVEVEAEVEDEVEDETEDETEDGILYPEKTLKGMKKAELVAICDELNIATDGTNAVLVRRIMEEQ